MVALQLLSILCLSKVLKTTVELKDQSLNTPNIALCPWHCAYLLIGTFYPDFVLHWLNNFFALPPEVIFVVPHARTAIKQHRAFSIVGRSVWNSLPSEIRSLPRDLSSSFYKLLKTFIFARAWAGSASE